MSLELVLFQPWLTVGTFYPCLLMDIMQETFLKCPVRLMFLQELRALALVIPITLAFSQIFMIAHSVTLVLSQIFP